MSNQFVKTLRRLGPQLIIRAAIMIALLVGAGLLLRHYDFAQIVGWMNFTPDGEAGLLHGPLAYFVLATLFTGIGGPRQAVSFFAAYFFGFAQGLLIALLATLAGALAAVAAAAGFREAAQRFIHGRLDAAIKVWVKSPFSITLMIRMLPVGSNLVTNLTAGVVGISLWKFAAGSAVGYLPQTLVFALMGAGVNVGSSFQVALSIVLFVISLAIGVSIYARHRREFKQRQRAAAAKA
jgi:uncharacterized membrane protein YdjX (TVP38/TMEM64 family)